MDSIVIKFWGSGATFCLSSSSYRSFITRYNWAIAFAIVSNIFMALMDSLQIAILFGVTLSCFVLVPSLFSLKRTSSTEVTVDHISYLPSIHFTLMTTLYLLVAHHFLFSPASILAR
jgi:uncharacterized membrane protein YgaE (UPF0421/DUF939 family)